MRAILRECVTKELIHWCWTECELRVESGGGSACNRDAPHLEMITRLPPTSISQAQHTQSSLSHFRLPGGGGRLWSPPAAGCTGVIRLTVSAGQTGAEGRWGYRCCCSASSLKVYDYFPEKRLQPSKQKRLKRNFLQNYF